MFTQFFLKNVILKTSENLKKNKLIPEKVNLGSRLI